MRTNRYRRFFEVSIHAPAWGATCVCVALLSSITKFQSTHPRGVRLNRSRAVNAYLAVSIHAPAWGATRVFIRCGPVVQKFQSTHPRGVRREAEGVAAAMAGFQSTHPRGVRRLERIQRVVIPGVSIHAPAWGATFDIFWLACVVCRFQSTHPRGVRRRSRCAA